MTLYVTLRVEVADGDTVPGMAQALDEAKRALLRHGFAATVSVIRADDGKLVAGAQVREAQREFVAEADWFETPHRTAGR